MTEPHGEDRLITGWLRPLAIGAISVFPTDSPLYNPSEEIDPGTLVSELCRNWSGDALEVINSRYARLSTQALEIFVVPADNLILEKIVWPLKSAKQAFSLGDFIGCIALCGMVCEMAIVFIYDIGAKRWDFSKFNAKSSQMFTNRQYEKEGQEKRVKVLLKLGAIPKELANDANNVRKIRREYLHFLSKDYANIEADAFNAYTSAFRVVNALVALPLAEEGKVAIPTHLESYLKSKTAQ